MKKIRTRALTIIILFLVLLNTSVIAEVDSVFFGTYDLLNDSVMGEVPVEWYVIEVSDDSYVLLSRYAVAERRIDSTPETSWKSTELSHWLNNEFLNEAFSDQEKEMIVKQYDGYVSLLKESDNRSVNPIIKNNPEIMLLEQTTDFQQKKWWLKLYPDLWLGLGDDKTRIRPAYDAKLFGDLYGSGMGYYEAATYYAIEEDRTAGNGYSVLEYGYPLNEPLAVRPVIVVQRDYVLSQPGIPKPNDQSSDIVIVDELIEAMMAPGESIFDTLKPIFADVSSVPYTYERNDESNELHDLISFQFTEDFLWRDHLIDSFAISVTSFNKICEELLCQVYFSIIDTSPKDNGATSEMFGNVLMHYEGNSDWEHNAAYGTAYKHKETSAIMNFEQETIESAGVEKRRLFFKVTFWMPRVDFDTYFIGKDIQDESNSLTLDIDEKCADVGKSSIIKLVESFMKKIDETEVSEDNTVEAAVALPIENNIEKNETKEDPSVFVCGDYAARDNGDGTCRIVDFMGTESKLIIPQELNGKAVVSIADDAFLSVCVDTIILPESMTTIEPFMFFYNLDLVSIILPNSIREIGEYAFANCKNLQVVKLSENLEQIGDNAFYNCIALNTVSVPSSVRSIGNKAFYNCSSLKNFSAPEGVERIGYFAFEECSMLESLYLPDSLISSHPLYLDGCTSLKQIQIPSRIKEISTDSECLSEIIGAKGSTAETIAQELNVRFTPSAAIQLYPLPEENDNYASFISGDFVADDYLDGTCGITYYVGTEKKVVIPETLEGKTVVSIQLVYEETAAIEELTIPGTITYIDFSAVSRCPNLRHITLEEGVRILGMYAFEGCYNLESITLPDTLKEIGESAFMDCDSLKEIHIPSSVRHLDADVFMYCDNLTHLTVPEGVISMDSRALVCHALKSVSIPNSLRNLSGLVLPDIGNMDSISIPKRYEHFVIEELEYWQEQYPDFAAHTKIILHE